MTILRPLILATALVGAPTAFAQNATAQRSPAPGVTGPTVPAPTPDADALAAAMRRLGANPRDLSASIDAGELSLRLGDVNAAAALFKRAETLDPMNGRVKAGMARILVTQERPGEALRYFDQATGYGLDPRSFAGDRALAYDLIGEPLRAQRDYRVALKEGRNDEIERRYALSLAISGKRDQALAEIDAQVRRNDRSAWRTRAFVLAMTGDVPGAEKIAATMMPAGMGAALAPFFARLPALSPVERAFAVHFGELRASPQRLADARMAPPLPVLAPEPVAAPPPQQLAANTAAPTVAAKNPRRDRQREREDAARARVLAREQARASRARPGVAPPVAVASVSTDQTSGFQPPRYAGVNYAPPRAVVQRVPTTATPLPTPAPAAASPSAATVAQANAASAAVSAPVLAATGAPTTGAPSIGTPLTGPERGAIAARTLSPEPQMVAGAVTRGVTPAATTAATGGVRAGQALPSPVPTAGSGAPTTVAPRVVAGVPQTAPGLATGAGALPQPGFASLAPGSGASDDAAGARSSGAAAVASAPPVVTRMNEDSIISRIMAGISIPAAELGVGPVRPAAAAPVAESGQASTAGVSVATADTIAAADAARRAAETERQARAEAARKPVAVAAVKTGSTATGPTATGAAARKPETGDAAPAEAKGQLAARGKAGGKTDASPDDATDVKLAGAKAGAGKAGAATAAGAGKTEAGKAGVAKTKAELAKEELAAKAKDAPVDPKKAAAERKALAAKKLADAKKIADAKLAAEEAKAAKADPPRIWVQVAGGANAGDLPKAWNAVQGKAAALKGKAAYSTPLRATNRVVTGPFKTDAEARAFVNTLAKQGVPAFSFTSEKGQKMKKLGDK